MNILAREYPRSTFVGYDIGEDASDAARKEAQQMELPNSTFEVVDVGNLNGEPKFDVITAFDAIHDQKAPDAVLRGVSRTLEPGGTFLMIEFKFSSQLEENIGNPFAPMYYGFSLMHCMPVSLAVEGAGLGAVWGEQTARKILAEAGFRNVKVVDTPRPQNCIFVCSR
jgi:ubiquinone/menaquinone biosynthesis C-methylase UbiE